MRLLELEIRDVRGIRDMHLKPSGRNLVIWGPNGSGKSAVVDAIDFLLTGRMTRLAGRGTGGISLARHGPHIDSTPDNAIVRAKVRIAGVDDSVEIERCIAHPGVLRYDVQVESMLKPVLQIASRGQHVLTRRDILQYITAEAGTRAQQIQHLLDVSEIESIRQVLVTVRNECRQRSDEQSREVRGYQGRVNVIVGQTATDFVKLLVFVNQQREILGGQPLSKADSSNLKENLAPPGAAPAQTHPPVNAPLVKSSLTSISNLLAPQAIEQRAKLDQDLRDMVRRFTTDPVLHYELSHRRLLELGIELIDESGACPLCDVSWPPGDLEGRLEQRLARAKEANRYNQRISKLATTLVQEVSTCSAGVQTLLDAADGLGLAEDRLALTAWLTRLEALSSSLAAPMDSYRVNGSAAKQIRELMRPGGGNDLVDRFQDALATRPVSISPEQAAWDQLTRLREALSHVEQARARYRRGELASRRADALYTSFCNARDQVLGSLYEAVRERFVSLYRQLHDFDDADFSARIETEGPGLDLLVDFYGRGNHPPHALHSEGHQDSMGVCLYLALAERLTAGVIDLVILDDVMMSVDAEHRRNLARLLGEAFPERQFIITTHDRAWANQLKNEGVIDAKGEVQFYDWQVETGPRVLLETDLWDRIAEDITKADISAAAGRLRRGAEQYLAAACDALQASVPFSLSGRYDLGDFATAAIARYMSLLKDAKRAANSWNQVDVIDSLRETESVAKQVIQRSQVEQWAVNASVHYNEWANLGAADFRDVVDTFQDLLALFRCPQPDCGQLLHITWVDHAPMNVRCACGAVNWNLKENG